MASPRIYIYGINHDGTLDFLMTELDNRGCRSYIGKHQKIFPNRFKAYTYGQMCDEKNTWEVVENGYGREDQPDLL